MTEAATSYRDRHAANPESATRYVVPVDWLTRYTFRFFQVMFGGFASFGILTATDIAGAVTSGRKLGLELFGFIVALAGMMVTYAAKKYASVTSAEFDPVEKVVLLTKRTASRSTIERIQFGDLRAAIAYRDIGAKGSYCGVRLVLKNGRSVDLDTYKPSLNKAQEIVDEISALCEIPPGEPVNPYQIYGSAKPS